MSLSKVLLSKGDAKVDSALDSIFKLNPVKPAPKVGLPTPAAVPVIQKSAKREKKRKTEEGAREEKKSKKRRVSDVNEVVVAPKPADVGVPVKAKTSVKSETVKDKKAKRKEAGLEGVVRDVASVVEETSAVADEEEDAVEGGGEETEEADEEDEDDELPVHESLLKEGDNVSSSKKRTRTDEPQEETDARTVFVGNIAVNVVKPKALKKQLITHLTSFVPHSSVDSIRFRSIAFKNPTSKLPEEHDTSKPSAKDVKSHERAEQWRKKASDPASGVVYQTEGEKKKAAFIKGEFHESIDTVNAYVVFSHPAEREEASGSEVLSAAEVANLVVERANGSTFLSKTLRVDHVGKQASGWGSSDPKLTVFVGNLDFAAKEEAIRAFFEQLVEAERGERPGEGTWVKTVRLVRDKATQLGKGFAYVSFVDRECVDHVLAADAEQLKFSKRTLRVQRCKSAPSTKSTRSAPEAPPSKAGGRPFPEKGVKGTKPTTRPPPVQVPKGDPKLGERLAGMDKDARKAAKAADPDRLARRLAKKKARAALGKGEKGEKDLDRGRRERKRVDKGGHGKGSSTKGRVRSDRAMAKRNVKK